MQLCGVVALAIFVYIKTSQYKQIINYNCTIIDRFFLLMQAITIIGGPESCTEACYQIMRIMQNELLTTNGSIFENG